jgi:predicted DNA-binding transcriptional regulator YafY
MAPTARLLKLLAILQEGPGLSAQTLAGRCGVSLRTIHRDLGVLLRLGYPIRFDAGYRLAAPDLMPPIQFTAEEALAARLALAGKGEPAARSAGAKLAALGDLALSPRPAPAGSQLPLDLPPVPDPGEAGRLADLHRAVVERRVARLVEARGGRPARQVALEAYRILFARGHWWVLGYAPARGRLIALAADRIRDVALTGRKFRQREGVRLERILARLGSGQATTFAATLRLASGAVPLATALPAHWLKGLDNAPDGSARLALATPHPEQLLAWVLALGDAAEVLEPPALRAELVRRGRLLVQRYAQDGAGR